MNEDEAITQLGKQIAERLEYDKKWAKWDFILSQSFVWLAIISSFLTAILAAAGETSNLVLAFLAAVPGSVILIDKNFSFAGRASWHREMTILLEQLANQLSFEGAKVEEVSKAYSELRLTMEKKFPVKPLEGLANQATKPK